MPDWYPYIRTAKYLNGVAPWELYEAPEVWFHWAQAAELAENQAADARHKQQRS